MRIQPIAFIALLASACSQSPEAQVQQWSLQPQGEELVYRFNSSGTYTSPSNALFHHEIEARDERGCIIPIYVDPVRVREGTLPARVEKDIDVDHKLASATLRVRHWTTDMSVHDQGTVVFSESKVLDSSLNPPDFPKESCSKESKESLRERAKTDPDGADSAAIESLSQNEVVATAINTAGFLCAQVTDMYPTANGIIVHCVEYRNGRGRVKYRVNTADMTVEQL